MLYPCFSRKFMSLIVLQIEVASCSMVGWTISIQVSCVCDVQLKLNIKKSDLEALLKQLPSLRNPTVNQLAQEGWVAVDTVIDEHVAREIIPELKASGAEGIIEYPLNKVVY